MSGSYGLPVDTVHCAPTPPQPVAATAEWFAVQTRYRFGKKGAAQLTHKGCEVYLPLLMEHHKWSDRQKALTTPLFPGYAFVHIGQSRDTWQMILKTAGLIGFVSFGSVVAPVPAKQIDDLKLLQRERKHFSLHPFVQAGQRVRIRGGCLHGIEGLLLKHAAEKLVISIESIQRSLAIEIQGYQLEPV